MGVEGEGVQLAHVRGGEVGAERRNWLLAVLSLPRLGGREARLAVDTGEEAMEEEAMEEEAVGEDTESVVLVVGGGFVVCSPVLVVEGGGRDAIRFPISGFSFCAFAVKLFVLNGSW